MQQLETVSGSIDEFEEEIPVHKNSRAQTLPHDSFKSCDYSLFASTAANLIEENDTRIKLLEKQVAQLQTTLEEKEQLVLLYKYRDKELKDKNAEFLKALGSAESKLSKVKMQYAKQLEFSRDFKELCQRNDQAINDIWREIRFEKLESVTTEKEADKAVQDMERKCDQKLAEHKEESHQ